MNKDTIKGSFKKFSGAIKQKAGELVGDKNLEEKGKVEQVEGKLEEGVGQMKDEARKVIDKV
ncbi:MAG: CsbD family protein [Rhodospirillum sp.]|nr:CsbD family protein [Rhodospirillum sp.]MCF8491532.1 CsbD family protein [Rhodospirillum sp.]MCF8501412.1 CsbD family protein [Rhodospirillum sp.]